jgi:predicted phosphodiesterase
VVDPNHKKGVIMRRPLATTLAGCVAASVLAFAQQVALPVKQGSVRFLVIGDTGTGGSAQRQLAGRIVAARRSFPFEFGIMLGDNLYGRERERDYRSKFEEPYKALLDANVKFYAALGNHDEPTQAFYKPFNMQGERYYSFKAPQGGVRFFAVDSNMLTPEQLAWLEKELKASGSEWKIAFFHHPIYSSGGRHGADELLREKLEPLFVEYGVDVVFQGHEHFYERLRPQKGVTYFVAGNAAKLRRGDITRTANTVKGYDQGYAFILAEIAGDEMHFQTIAHDGRTVDSGVVRRREAGTTRTSRQ